MPALRPDIGNITLPFLIVALYVTPFTVMVTLPVPLASVDTITVALLP